MSEVFFYQLVTGLLIDCTLTDHCQHVFFLFCFFISSEFSTEGSVIPLRGALPTSSGHILVL